MSVSNTQSVSSVHSKICFRAETDKVSYIDYILAILTYFDFATFSGFRCMDRSYRLTYIDMNTGLLQFNETGFEESGYSLGSNTLHCFYQEIFRPIDDDYRLEYGPKIPIVGIHEPQTDFIYVACVNFLGLTVYHNFHAYARRRPEVRKFKVNMNMIQRHLLVDLLRGIVKIIIVIFLFDRTTWNWAWLLLESIPYHG